MGRRRNVGARKERILDMTRRTARRMSVLVALALGAATAGCDPGGETPPNTPPPTTPTPPTPAPQTPPRAEAAHGVAAAPLAPDIERRSDVLQ